MTDNAGKYFGLFFLLAFWSDLLFHFSLAELVSAVARRLILLFLALSEDCGFVGVEVVVVAGVMSAPLLSFMIKVVACGVELEAVELGLIGVVGIVLFVALVE